MKVVKPRSLSLLTRPFEYRGRIFCGFSVIAFLPIFSERTLLSEMAMWPFVAETMGRDAIIDEGIPKSRAEYMVCGKAWCTTDDGQVRGRARVRFGDLDKSLNVFGARHFEGDRIIGPDPFQSVPLSWSNAFGGEGFGRNPLGVGFKPSVDDMGNKVHRLPQLEYPDDMLTLPGQRTRPAGFGAIDISWPQRLSKAGTHDDKWLKTRYPGFPDDVDWSVFNMASEDQQFEGFLQGDEEFELHGLHPERQHIKGRLPGIRTRCLVRRKASEIWEDLSCRLSTVWFFPESEHIILVHHASTPINEPDASDLDQVLLGAEALEQSRSIAHYVAVWTERQDPRNGSLAALDDSGLLPEGLRSDGGFDPDETLRDGLATIRRKRVQTRLEDELCAARAVVQEEMKPFGAKLPDLPPPDMGCDPKRLDQIRLRDLPRIRDQMAKESERSRKELEEMAASGKTQQAEAMAALAAEFPDYKFDDVNLGGPPAPRSARVENDLRKTVAEMEESGFDGEKMRAELLSPKMLGLIRGMDDDAIATYRASSHMLQPVSGRSGEEARDRLIRALAAGESLDRVDLSGADLSGMDLSGADLRGVFLEAAQLVGCRLDGAQVDRAVLAHANLQAASLVGASLAGANLGKANLIQCVLEGSDLTNAVLVESDLRAACLDGAKLERANLRGAHLNEASLCRVQARALLLMDSELSGLNFSQASLVDAVFINSDLRGAVFDESDLTMAVFMNCNAAGARFVRANAPNLRVVLATDLTATNFGEAKLPDANLREARLGEACFRGARLERTDLSGCFAERADFSGAVACASQWVGANLKGSDMQGVNLMQSSLERADIRQVNLRGSNLYQADLARVHVDKSTVFDEVLSTRMRTYPRKFSKEP